MSNFFILGLPRSRTNWLTAYFNSKETLCVHECFSFDGEDKDFWEINKYKYKGSCDTNSIVAKPYMKDVDAPLVVIDRDCQDVYRSFIKKFKVNKNKLKSVLYEMHDELEKAKEFADLVVKFEDLDSRLHEVQRVCTPDIKYCEVRHMIYKNMKIDTNSVPEEFLWHTGR